MAFDIHNIGLNLVPQGAANTTIIVAEFLFVFLVIFGIAIFLILKSSYKVKCFMKVKTGNNIKFEIDRGKFKTKDGVTTFVFWSNKRRKIKLQNIDPSFVYPQVKKGNGIEFYQYGEKEIVPVQNIIVEEGNNLKLSPRPALLDEWNQVTKKAQTDKYRKKSLFELYGTHILLFFTIIAIVIMVWITIAGLKNAATHIDSLAAACQSYHPQAIT